MTKCIYNEDADDADVECMSLKCNIPKLMAGELSP